MTEREYPGQWRHLICVALAEYDWFISVLAFLCARNIRKYNVDKKPTLGTPTILALKEDRFRGDLEILQGRSSYSILRMPDRWLGRFYRWFYGYEDVGGSHRSPVIAWRQGKYRRFLDRFLRNLVERLRLSLVIGSGANYKAIKDWGAVFEQIGVPYLVFHREGFMGSRFETDHILDWGRSGQRFEGTKLVLQCQQKKKLLIESEFVDPAKVVVAGCMRMDSLVSQRESDLRDGKGIERSWVTLFSFGVATGLLANYWPEGWKNGGNLFFTCTSVHVAVAEFAKENPSINVMIKLKWSGQWKEAILWMLSTNGINPSQLPNLYIEDSIDAQEQIGKSRVVIGYGSTTLLESAIRGVPVIVPGYGEVADPGFADKVTYPDLEDCFLLAEDPADLKSKIKKSFENPYVSPHTMELREKAFEKYLSFPDGSSTERYLTLLADVIGPDSGKSTLESN